jgi:hypothetical protein
VLLLILSQQPATAGFGIVLWGLGAALGFPVGVSAAADGPARAALRVSVVSSIGMGAYLAGPPLLGFVGNQVGTLNSLSVVVVTKLPAALLAHHAAPTGDKKQPLGDRIAMRSAARRGSQAGQEASSSKASEVDSSRKALAWRRRSSALPSARATASEPARNRSGGCGWSAMVISARASFAGSPGWLPLTLS